MTDRSVVVGRDGRAKAYRPLPDADRAAALASGLAAYERGDFFEAHEDLEPAWMGTDDRAERALLQGLIKVAAAYVHDVRGNPAGIGRNLEGARALLVEAAEDGPCRQHRAARHRCPRRGDRSPPGGSRHPSRWSEPPSTDPAKERPMSQPGIPTIDVAEAERRLREDPAGPILLDVREINEFEEVRAPGAVLIPTSTFMTRVDELPTERPLMVVCHMGGRSAAVAGFLIRSGRNDVVNVAGGMEAWERAGLPVRRGTVEPGEGDLPAG